MATETRETNGRMLTEFGATVLSLMNERGVTSQAELVALLEKHDLGISQPGFSKWLYGRSAASSRFPQAFADALGLNEAQKGRLVHAFAFGQNCPVKKSPA